MSVFLLLLVAAMQAAVALLSLRLAAAALERGERWSWMAVGAVFGGLSARHLWLLVAPLSDQMPTTEGLLVRIIGSVGVMVAFLLIGPSLARLRRSHHRLQALIDHAPFLLAEGDTSGRFEVVGGAFLCALPDAYGHDLAAHLWDEDTRRAVLAGEITQREVQIGEAIALVRYVARGSSVVVVGIDVTDRVRMRQARQASEAHLRAIIDQAPQCVKLLDSVGHVLEVNAAGLAMIETDSAADLIGRRATEMIVPEHRTRFEQAITEALSGATVTTEFEIVGFKGTHRLVRQHLTQVHETGDESAAPRLVAVTYDITAEHEVAAALESARVLLRTVLDSSPDWIFAKDMQHRYLFVNEAFAAAHGVTPDDMVGHADTEFALDAAIADDPAQAMARLRADENWALAGQRARTMRELTTLQSGETHVLDTIRSPLRGADNAVIGVLAYARDMTDQQQAVSALTEHRELLAEAQQIARLGNWTLDLRSNDLVWSDEVFRIFEVDPASPPLSYEGFLTLVHPDDRDLVDRTFRRSVEERQPYLVTHRLQFPDMRVKWVEEIGRTDFAEDGTAAVSRGTVQDITERIALRADADRFANELARVVDASPLPIVMIDDRGKIVSSNPSTTRTFGWTAEELVGRNVAMLASGVSETQHDGFLRHYLETGEASTREGLVIDRTRAVRARRADGSEFPAQLTVAEIAQLDGQRRFVGILMDLTEWQAREDQIVRMQKLDALGTLVAGVAHDFNNLLTAIRGGLSLAVDHPEEPRWPRVALEATDRAAALVQQLLRYSRRESTDFIEISVLDAVRNVATMARETIDRRVWVDSDMPDAAGLPTVLGDRNQIEQVILNLC